MTSEEHRNVALEALNQLMVEHMAERIQRMGEKESGAYPFYRVRVEKRRMITDTELGLAKALASLVDTNWLIHEIGAGIGNFALAMVAMGYEAYAIEMDRRRYAAMNSLHQALKRNDSAVAGRFHPILGRFPSAETERAKRAGKTVVLSTNLAGTMSPEAEQSILSAYATYPIVVLDIQRFGHVRDEAAQEVLLNAVRASTGRAGTLLFEQGAAGRYYAFSA